jgi:hypothetical protein
MSKMSIMDSIWKLTLLSFVFVQIIGVIVVASLLATDSSPPTKLILLAYAAFLMLSGLVFVVARGIWRMVKRMYE